MLDRDNSQVLDCNLAVEYLFGGAIPSATVARYRFILPVRAIGGYRLPEGGLTAGGVTLTPATAPAYTARVDDVQADTAALAYERAQQLAELLFSYLAILGEDAAFILDGREGVRASNLDLEEHPTPADQPPPPFESIGGVITVAGQEYFGALLDPDGNKRRSGAIVIHNAQGAVVPGQERLTHICDLFGHPGTIRESVRIALGIIHDAACAREPANGFAQSFTALEVLTGHLQPPTVLNAFFQQAFDENTINALPHQTKGALLEALRGWLTAASLSPAQAERIANYASMTRSVSQVDVFLNYVTGLGIAVTRAEVVTWRDVRGALVHAAAANAEQAEAMRRCREVVRAAVLEELQRAAAANA